MIGLKLKAILLVGSLAVGSFVSWQASKSYYTAIHESYISRLETETQDKIAEVERQKRESEQALETSKDLLESMYENAILVQNNIIDDLIRERRRLRDPSANVSSGAGVPSDSSSAECSIGADEDRGLLSVEASEFLLRLVGEADQTLEQLRLCREWAESVREIANP